MTRPVLLAIPIARLNQSPLRVGGQSPCRRRIQSGPSFGTPNLTELFFVSIGLQQSTSLSAISHRLASGRRYFTEHLLSLEFLNSLTYRFPCPFVTEVMPNVRASGQLTLFDRTLHFHPESSPSHYQVTTYVKKTMRKWVFASLTEYVSPETPNCFPDDP
jgi:hypothetical protein